LSYTEINVCDAFFIGLNIG